VPDGTLGKHRIIAVRSGATSYLRSKCIISPQAMHHLTNTFKKKNSRNLVLKATKKQIKYALNLKITKVSITLTSLDAITILILNILLPAN